MYFRYLLICWPPVFWNGFNPHVVLNKNVKYLSLWFTHTLLNMRKSTPLGFFRQQDPPFHEYCLELCFYWIVGLENYIQLYNYTCIALVPYRQLIYPWVMDILKAKWDNCCVTHNYDHCSINSCVTGITPAS